MAKVKFIRDIKKITQLSQEKREELKQVVSIYPFRINEYYLDLIDWDNPADPIKNIVIPSTSELQKWGRLDPSNEKLNYKVPGLQHKYKDTALLVLNNACGSYCRFCFRKRIFMDDSDEAVLDTAPGLEYIRNHPEITNVLLTGGDPLLLSTSRLEVIVKELRKISHINIIRIGSKIPIFNPYRVLDDPRLAYMLDRYSSREKRIYVMLHVNHPLELAEPALKAFEILSHAGAILCNQTPILRGVNDNPDILEELMKTLSFIGVAPYYFFINRPTEGNRPFCLPITESYKIFRKATKGLSGLARRARLVMSHTSGKIEVAGLTDKHIFLRYHRARNPEDELRMMVYERDDRAFWFDELSDPVELI